VSLLFPIGVARVVPVIDELRRRFPGTWTYERAGRCWRRSDGAHAHWCAALAPRYDGDDDNFTSQLWFYPALGKPGTPELVQSEWPKTWKGGT
jgi:hypothetical protein